jgi:hypothetical protein
MKNFIKTYLIFQWMLLGLIIERTMAGLGLIKCLDLFDTPFASGQDNTGGLTQEWYYAYAEDIETWPTYFSKDSATTPEQLMNYAGNFIMKSGKQFHEGYLTWGTGELKWDAQGPMDCKSYKHTFELSRPSADAKILAFIDLVKNANLVIICRDKDGNYRVIGSEFLAAKYETDAGTTGKTGEDYKGDVITFMSELESAPKFYPGVIPVTPAS